MCIDGYFLEDPPEYGYRIGWKVFGAIYGRRHLHAPGLYSPFAAHCLHDTPWRVGIEMSYQGKSYAYQGPSPLPRSWEGIYVFDNREDAQQMIDDVESGNRAWNLLTFDALVVRKVLARHIIYVGHHQNSEDDNYRPPAFMCRHITIMED